MTEPNSKVQGGAESRARGAWQEWLTALASDAEAALAAAIAYRDLCGADRGAWLDVLAQDDGELSVPKVAVYAPLLAVESDPERRSRILKQAGPEATRPADISECFALSGRQGGGRVGVIVSPMYLDFFQVLACRYDVHTGFGWVRHEPIVSRSGAPREGDEVEGATLERTPLQPLIDDLALAVLAHQRQGLGLPEALCGFAHLFEPVRATAVP
jgi:hypothetical protein